MAARKPREHKDPAPPVRVDNFTRRNDNDALEGAFVDVIDGDYKGVRGAYVQTLEHDPDSGYPQQVLVRAREHGGEHDLVSVAYADVRPSGDYRGGR